MKPIRIQTILDFLPRLSFGYFTNHCVIKTLTNDMKDILEDEIELDSFLIHVETMLKDTIHILKDNFAIEVDIKDIPKMDEADQYLNGKTEVWKDEYYNVNSAIEYCLGGISLLNIAMDCIEDKETINLHLVEDIRIRNILLDINKQCLEQDRESIFRLSDFACCEYIHI